MHRWVSSLLASTTIRRISEGIDPRNAGMLRFSLRVGTMMVISSDRTVGYFWRGVPQISSGGQYSSLPGKLRSLRNARKKHAPPVRVGPKFGGSALPVEVTDYQ